MNSLPPVYFQACIELPTGCPCAFGSQRTGGTEFIREGCIPDDKQAADVPAPSRMNSLAHECLQACIELPTGCPCPFGSQRTDGSEFIWEGCIPDDKQAADVPAPSRMNSLPHECLQACIELPTGCPCPFGSQRTDGSEFIREGAIPGDKQAADVPSPSRMNSAPHVCLQANIESPTGVA